MAERRITFFVEDAESSADGWVLTGKVGLGPLQVGDTVSFVHHQDNQTDEEVELVVLAINDTSLTLSTGATALRRGDILGGTKQID